MKRLLFFLTVVTLVSCGRSFEKRTAKYAEVGEMSDNRAAVLDINEGVGRWGYVDGTGRLAIECRYADARRFADGLAAVQVPEGAWGYIDTVGRLVIAPQFVLAEPFEDGMAWVQAAGELWGRVDKSGKMVIPCLYSEIGEPDERGWMRVLRDGKWGYLRENGEVVVPCDYNLIGEPNAYGLIPVTSGGKHGFLDADGREVLPCFFTYISDFKDGYARTNYGGSMMLRDEPYGGQWGLIDTLGRETIPCRYYYLDTPGEGLAAFMLEQFGNFGYVDVKGNVAISPRFAVAKPFSGGVAVVSYNNVNYGLVDRNGNEVSSFRYKRIGEFHDGLAPFNTNLYGMNFQGMEPRCGHLPTFSDTFSETIDALGAQEPRICAITAAMLRGTGLDAFAAHYPERCFDVGIAEGHAVSMAGGLAKQGMIPVVAIYSTFLQRAYDMLLQDVAMLGLHVVFAVDRAGLVGGDGETHHGVFDVNYLRSVPGMQVLCPASQAELDRMLRRAVLEMTGPVAVRYPRGCDGAFTGIAEQPCLREGSDITLVTYGTLVNEVLAAAKMLQARGISAEVLKLPSIKPLDVRTVAASMRKTGRLLVAEESVCIGCVGKELLASLRARGVGGPVRLCNLGDRFIPHGAVPELYRLAGLDARSLADAAWEVCQNEA